jgi:hypothetical protein
LVAHE